MGEEVPRAQVLRGTKRKGTRYFGPYGHAWAIRETLDLLLRVFPVRTMVAVRGCSAWMSWKYDDSRGRSDLALPT
jgi:excinuclease UvrABC nuclease subunit